MQEQEWTCTCTVLLLAVYRACMLRRPRGLQCFEFAPRLDRR